MEEQHWFALKVFYNKIPQLAKEFIADNIEIYVAYEKVATVRKGVKKIVTRPIIASLMFFRSTDAKAVEIQSKLGNRALVYTRKEGQNRVPVRIPDRQMNIFMLVCSSGQDGLEYYGAGGSDFSKGDYVRVTGGPFEGAEGHVVRIKGSRRLVVSIEGVCAIATSYIPNCFLMKLPPP